MPTWKFFKCTYTLKATNSESYILCLILPELKVSIFQLSFLYLPLKFVSFRSLLHIKSSESASKYITAHLQAENPRHFISVQNNTDFSEQHCSEEILQKREYPGIGKQKKWNNIASTIPPTLYDPGIQCWTSSHNSLYSSSPTLQRVDKEEEEDVQWRKVQCHFYTIHLSPKTVHTDKSYANLDHIKFRFN